MGGMSMILIFLLPLLLIFFMSRNQTKKQKNLESSLKTGDRVVTQSGLIGRIVEMNDGRVKLEIAPGVNVQILKSSLQGLDPGDTKAAEAKAKEAGKDSGKEKKA
jgi:preprotein translocase subunit YajC